MPKQQQQQEYVKSPVFPNSLANKMALTCACVGLWNSKKQRIGKRKHPTWLFS